MDRSHGEYEGRIFESSHVSARMTRNKHLAQFKDVEFHFSDVQKSVAWPMVNQLIESSKDKGTSHLFQIQHDWCSLLKDEIEHLVRNWGRPEFAVHSNILETVFDSGLLRESQLRQSLEVRGILPEEASDLFADPVMSRYLPNAGAVRNEDELKADEYLVRREKLLEELAQQPGALRKHVIASRSIDNPPDPVVVTCVCGKTKNRSDGRFAGKLICAACGTKPLMREEDEEAAEAATSLLIPYPTSFFEFMVNNHHWLVEVIEQEDRSSVLKYYFFHDEQWHQATLREFAEIQVFQLLKRQVIGVLIAMEANVAVKSNHEDARRPPTPAMLTRLRKIFNVEFNFGYSVIDLTKRTKSSPGDDTQPAWKVRLHFRRGYWRTRLSKRERVRWCLVGDPSLGFVDKHYKF